MTTKRKSAPKADKTPAPEKQTTPVQEALQTTWLLKGTLKNAQLSYLRVGVLLAKVRDQKLYAALDHPDIEDYAFKRLQLRKSSTYRYLQVYDWVQQSHPEWLQPKPKGFIPELSDVADLMWLENELKRTNLSAPMRATLESMQKKALNGQLSHSEIEKWRKKAQRGNDGLKSFLSTVRSIRRRGTQLGNLPHEAIKLLDAAIELIQNTLTASAAK